jgi:rhodanese-related sulfurtransferase/DNA-binding transcriptional ArsR family regulator
MWESAARDTLYEQFARIGKVTGHPKRLELLDLLCQREHRVEELAQATGLKLTTASAQMQVLRQARLVSTRRDGKHIYYRVADDSVCDLLQAVQHVARAQLSEVGEVLRDSFETHDPAEPVGVHELQRRIGAGEDIVVIDVRPRGEYEAGHIAGAVSIPLDELAQRLAELPADAAVVAYCRGPLCILAAEAVGVLRTAGRPDARRLEVGFPQWRRAGLPSEAGVGS